MMYPQMKIDDCWTYTSRGMELNTKSNQEWDGWMGQKLNAPVPLSWREHRKSYNECIYDPKDFI